MTATASAATRVIEQLSDVLRSTLNRTQSTEVALEDELGLVRQYLAVEQARFSDRLRPVLDIDGATLRAAVPRFALQHLVENALRHGVAKRTEAGRVAITARRDRDVLILTVEDDGPGLATAVQMGKATGSTTPASACGRYTLTGLRSPSAPRPCKVRSRSSESRIVRSRLKAEPRGNQ